MAGRKVRHFLLEHPLPTCFREPDPVNRAEAKTIADGLVRLDPAAAFNAGLDLLNADYPEILLPAVRRLSERNRADARLAQLHGLAARASGEGPLAFSAFARAARLAPSDALIAQSHAQTALEAGKPAVDLFAKAARLAPQNGSVLLGMAAALVADRRSEDAIEHLSGILARNPLWTDGHRSLAAIRAQLALDPLTQIDLAIASLPTSAELHRLRIGTLLEARRNAEALEAAERARAALGSAPWLDLLAGHAASENDDYLRADDHFAAAAPLASADAVSLLARHLLRAGRPDQAASLLEPRLHDDERHLYWPYLSLAWRLIDDPRHDWLEGDESLVGVYDLEDRVGDLDVLADHLRKLHFAIEPPLDQSVRGGTQTDGNLLLRDEEPLRRLRQVLLETVATHIDRLPPAREGHPTLLAHREPQRIAGSWSVRLRDAGFHTDHVHSQGWLSSAFYVALPASSGNDHAGWLSLGESRDLVPELSPLRLVEPQPGRLVLFPSTMWHGTRPFPSGERLTVAFDISVPKQ